MKKVTSQDVAARAGVSQSAVSLILNQSDKVLFNDETRDRVFTVAKELGYELPKRKKRALASRSGLLLLFTPTLNNPYYTELAQTAESYADACGYCVIVCNTLRKPELERYYLETFLKMRVDGMIFTFLPSFPEIVESVAESVPSVLIGEKRSELSICSIELSNERAGTILAEHLYGLGHRRFLFVSTPFNQLTLARRQRLDGIRACLNSHGLDESSVELITPDSMPETDALPDAMPYEYVVGRELVGRAIEQGTAATAIIGVNDMTAVGVIDEIRERGASVPADYSVCGFDNIFNGSVSTPALTTIDHHLQVRCKAAVDQITARRRELSETTLPPVINKVEYSPRLVVRASTGPARTESGTTKKRDRHA